VLAVLAPGLRDHLDLYICGLPREPEGGAFLDRLCGGKISLHGTHLVEGEGKEPRLGESEKLAVIHG
jgi:hypothetical protein